MASNKLVVPHGIIVCSATPEKVYPSNDLVHTGRIQFMGGEYRAANPQKLNGEYRDIEIAVDIRDQAKSYGAKEGRSAGALITKEISFTSILSGKPAK